MKPTRLARLGHDDGLQCKDFIIVQHGRSFVNRYTNGTAKAPLVKLLGLRRPLLWYTSI